MYLPSALAGAGGSGQPPGGDQPYPAYLAVYRCAGVILNRTEPGTDEAAASNRAALDAVLPFPVLAELPYIKEGKMDVALGKAADILAGELADYPQGASS